MGYSFHPKCHNYPEFHRHLEWRWPPLKGFLMDVEIVSGVCVRRTWLTQIEGSMKAAKHMVCSKPEENCGLTGQHAEEETGHKTSTLVCTHKKFTWITWARGTAEWMWSELYSVSSESKHRKAIWGKGWLLYWEVARETHLKKSNRWRGENSLKMGLAKLDVRTLDDSIWRCGRLCSIQFSVANTTSENSLQ